MRTTINLKEELVRDLMKCTKSRTKTHAIETAIDDLILLSGKVNIETGWQKEEEAEASSFRPGGAGGSVTSSDSFQETAEEKRL
jgi:hypothetical protein